MSALATELQCLQSALTAVVATRTDLAGVVDAYVRAIARKHSFASIHLRTLTAIDWARVDGLGRAGAYDGDHLVLKLEDASLELRHPAAVSDHVYLAFDGLIAAAVNTTDTFARLVNGVYGLGLPERQASLHALREKCSDGTPLGSVLRDGQHTAWLVSLKRLGGRCQHADIEEVLVNPPCCYGKRPEPLVPAAYSWQPTPTDLNVAAYGQLAVDAAEATLFAATRAILGNPTSPV